MLGIQRIRTTPYHPSSNGMVERLYRTLKQAIRCHDTKWTESLPVVLLGLRACIKEDLNASCAEMVFGKTIVLPGEFFEPSSQTPTDPSEFLLRLRETFRTLKPTSASCHSSTSCFVHTALKTCSHVFVRVEGLKPSLTAPYQGPFEVLSRTDKHFTIKINDMTSTISIDRLKPAFLLKDSTKEPFPVQKSNHPVVLPPRLDQNVPIPATTRFGRKSCPLLVRWVRGYAKQWKPFVSNRVHEIQDLTNPQNWRFVKGEQNPADIVSRGCSAEELLKNRRLWHGPHWLTLSEENWPKNERLFQKTTNEERRVKNIAINYSSEFQNEEPILDINNFSSVSKVFRIMAWIRRFINNMKLIKKYRIKTPLTVEEIEEEIWIKKVQAENFGIEINCLKEIKNLPKDSKIRELNPFLNERGIVRISGRLHHKELETVLCEIEAVLNSRPITYIDSDSTGKFPLAPSHFLLGRRLTCLPAVKLTTVDCVVDKKVLKRFNFRERLLNNFWRKDYLLNLKSAHFVNPTKETEFKINDIVLIHDDRLPRSLWKLGNVIETFTGRDKRIRACAVKTENSVIKRPVQLLHNLEIPKYY
ncbi:DUF5641 domain-containing protein [Trichonephila inaurata madagascariensis]|uniref:DUF5641 domain-containing protein n=1 Tax=Trichonephila inaurata madagascariensis TaxID=2747483 RepID=A0A8X6YSV6_9ARAC|nr:DUF5641 domain-containing protein [Trichonephila inaurata madagascariensis]